MNASMLIQGTPEWLEYRRSRGNASEVAALMGCSPFTPKTPYELWLIKSGRAEIEQTDAMRRGIELEPLARAHVEAELEEVFEPVVCEQGRLSASLDGITLDGETIIEIKVPMQGSESSTWRHVAERGRPPLHYWYQVQQQLLCSGAKRCLFYVCAESGRDMASISCEVRPDMLAHDGITRSWDFFFTYLDSDEPPPRTEDDVIERQDDEWRRASDQWARAKEALEQAKITERAAWERLISLADGQSVTGNRVSATRYYLEGSIDYATAARELNLDLSRYRKPGRWQYRITQTKGK